MPLIVNGATVWSLDPERIVGVSIAGKARLIEARRVIIATGSQERPFPIPGWTLPGVMTAGAAQTVLKAQGLLPDGRTVMAGTGPLLWLLAAQILRAGGKIEAILDTTPRRNLAARAAASARLHAVAVLRQGPGAAARGEGEGAGPSCRRASRPYGDGQARARSCPTAARDAGRSPAAASGRGAERQSRPRGRRDARLERAPALLPAGARRRISAARCPASPWRATARASPAARRRPSAAASRPSPRCARSSPMRRLPDPQSVRQRLQREEMGRAFLDWLNRPADSFRQPEGDTLVCRCEEVTAAQVRDTADHGLRGAEPDEGLPALRHGAVPGPAVRPHRHRADRRRSASARRPRSATTACARR